MKRVRRRDTSIELRLRRLLHARGLRYRVDRRTPESGRSRPDLVFVGARVAIFVDSCFWHACPEHGTLPRTNLAFWREKLRQNSVRDRAAKTRLEAAGWTVIRVWEHEDMPRAAQRITSIVIKCSMRTKRRRGSPTGDARASRRK
jgi:DNA mismatch endonuclease, patch repair protein